MKLEGLLQNVHYTVLQGDLNKNIRWISHDSRDIIEDSLFVCIDGYEVDGHSFISSAIDKGAKALVVTKYVQTKDSAVTVIQVDDARLALAEIATKYFNTPTNQFNLIGVTGTNGKTSTVFLIDRILKGIGKKTGMIGTIENHIGNQVLQTSRTTPDALALQHLFHEMVKENVNNVTMEVSSHALSMKRVHGSEFDVAVFTNLTLDHLDYHKTMEAYRDAKLELFNMAPKAVVNLDDENGQYIIDQCSADEILTYSCCDDSADMYAFNIHIDIKGTHFELNYGGGIHHVDIQTPGRFSVYNAMAALGGVLMAGVNITKAIEVLAKDSVVRGRFETIESNSGFFVVVDYAHAPDGLEKVLTTINELAKGRIITVFGCGGDRDRSKRPVMGEIAGRLSDVAIITSDNPRTEDPQAILDEVETGILDTDCTYEKIVDRVAAIRKALAMAEQDDIVLIAGKGHEDYQVIGKVKIHMDDLEIVKSYLEEVQG